MAIPNNPASVTEPVGVVGSVSGEVLIDRGGERVPVLGGEQLFASDKLISVGDGRASVQFANPTKGGGTVTGNLMPGGEVLLKPIAPESAIRNLNSLAAEGFEIVELTPEDAVNQVQSTAMRAMLGALSTGAGVSELVGRAATTLINSPVEASEALSEAMVPGLNISAARAEAIAPVSAHSAEMEMLSQAALQSVTSMSAAVTSDRQMPNGQSPASSDRPALIPEGGLQPMPQDFSREIAEDLTGQSSAFNAAGSFGMVSDIAAAAPAVMGKEGTSEVVQNELLTALGLKQSEETTVQAAQDEPVKPASLEKMLSDAEGLLQANPLQTSIQSVEETVKNVTGMDTPSIAAPVEDSAGRLLQMIESFESKLNDLTGLVYSAFEGVGPDVLLAKSDFSTLPTSQLVTDSVAGASVVTGFLETALAPLNAGTGASDLSSLTSTLVSGESASLLAGGLVETLSGLGVDLNSIVSVFDDLAAGTNSQLLNNVTGTVDNLLDNLTGGGSGSGGSGNPLDNLLDNLTGGGSGGSGSGGSGNPLDNLLDNLTGGGSGGSGSGGSGNPLDNLLDNLTGGGSGGSGSGGSGNPLDNLLDNLTGGGSGGSGSGGSGNPLDNLLDNLTGGGSGGSGGGGGLLNQLTGIQPSALSAPVPDGLPDADVGGLLGNLLLPAAGGLLNSDASTGGDAASPSGAPADVPAAPQQDPIDLGQSLSSALSSSAGSDAGPLPDIHGLL